MSGEGGSGPGPAGSRAPGPQAVPVRSAGPARVAVIGARGRMGRFALQLLAADANYEVVAEVERGDDLGSALASGGAELGLDLTVAGLGLRHGMRMLEAGVRPVIGTSGVSPQENDELDAAARRLQLGGLVVPNFSLGVWLLQRFCDEAVRHLHRAEIVETHHEAKRDVPSGTALATAERMAAASGLSTDAFAIHSLRLPGPLSNQEVVFGGRGEVLRISHETYSIASFGPGILAALRHARSAVGVARGLGAALTGAQE
jgi:4-hydroxy-tetrahydrodipicolinate reductase